RDWSSDVCSSDLRPGIWPQPRGLRSPPISAEPTALLWQTAYPGPAASLPSLLPDAPGVDRGRDSVAAAEGRGKVLDAGEPQGLGDLGYGPGPRADQAAALLQLCPHNVGAGGDPQVAPEQGGEVGGTHVAAAGQGLDRQPVAGALRHILDGLVQDPALAAPCGGSRRSEERRVGRGCRSQETRAAEIR